LIRAVLQGQSNSLSNSLRAIQSQLGRPSSPNQGKGVFIIFD